MLVSNKKYFFKLKITAPSPALLLSSTGLLDFYSGTGIDKVDNLGEV